jgi:hypothetical protein
MPFRHARVDQQPREYKNDASPGRIEVTRRGSRTTRSGRPISPAAILYAFDLIEHDGENLRNRPFLDRATGATIARHRTGHPAHRAGTTLLLWRM